MAKKKKSTVEQLLDQIRKDQKEMKAEVMKQKEMKAEMQKEMKAEFMKMNAKLEQTKLPGGTIWRWRGTCYAISARWTGSAWPPQHELETQSL